MGISLAWIGVQARTPNDVQEMLGLTETGASGEFFDFAIAGIVLPNDWYLLTALSCDHWIRSDVILAELSAHTPVVACSIEEHVMFVSTAQWRAGEQVWSVQHRGGDYGVDDLVIEGTPPDYVPEIHRLRGECLLHLGGANFDQAIREFETAIAAASDSTRSPSN